MPATSTNYQNSPFATTNENAYFGNIIFGSRTIYFSETTIVRQNISRIEKFGLKKIYRISTILLIISIVLAIGGFGFAPYGLIITAIFGWIAYIGIKERMRPNLSGLTIELNSGYRHAFFSADQNGIRALFNRIHNALEKGETFSAEFKVNKIEINDNSMNTNISNAHGVVVAGPGAFVNANIHVQHNDLQSLQNELAKLGVMEKDIQELKNIIHSEQPNHSQKRVGDKVSRWIAKVAASLINVSEDLLAQYIAHYYGWN